ncbi:hypothetical protein BCU70_05625 [Vibrio sp. 10N.286.49.C2]|uniref:hypothetical protein n=1 Tax=unclassified Vibrio TaxID=2614977 RepID=UPI000C85AF8B|nr:MULTISPECIES: hypothetical protein [unclassified Vibrio]PMH33955.1 hypothetical protein BCU70_05625 [Vibrio sp. 10N.286.49.C2]PMH44214.1 hypothetical protein BCU66_04545 [Vibrio sp. 10N.286.49.B1]PMH79933.1 hypothetical protein BCU58_04215 [Vibrio sp. 10N.286.48.B7]
MKATKLFILPFILTIFGCASGSSILVGEAREAILPEQVRLYVNTPESYEIIALVNAASDAGLTKQDSINYAVEELKKQAALVGANGVILETTGSNNSVLLGGQGTDYQYLIPVSEQTVSGKAIYVKQLD